MLRAACLIAVTFLAIPLEAMPSMAGSACQSLLAEASLRIREMKTTGNTISFAKNAGFENVSRVTFGVPFWVRSIKAGSRIFRRYMDEKCLSETTQLSQLRAGICPYVRQEGPYREEFPNLVGIFLTTRSYSSERVGLEADMPFVDFTLPPETELFMIEPGIYVIAIESITAPILRQIHEASADRADELQKKLRAAERKERTARKKIKVPIKIIRVGP